ncbi:hypothetical protein PLICRDRAFT_109538 [Plicaturopsis crispa FD-325 SS-3]|nr:hypothetical protein PLICRDRAFT_109538 [Plicaturopsis crispa FD-325 SS-3]
MQKGEASSSKPPASALYVEATKLHGGNRHRFAQLKVLLILALSAAITLSFLTYSSSFTQPSYASSGDPASEWQDNIWPLRPPTSWDISTDFPYTRTFEYDVTEGTWLRLDVHPRTGDIVFDMAGDLYCLPAKAYLNLDAQNDRTRAVPVLLGVPHDSDPHFSPDGTRIVFRSDAELGVENIWISEWKGCESMDLRPINSAVDADLEEALEVKAVEESMLASGIKETAERNHRRLVREGRASARRVTNETYRWVSDARFHPSEDKVIATKWYTSSRSLGAGEGWEYSIPSVDTVIEPGSGKRLLGRSLPAGWTAAQYGDQQIGPEQFIWSGNDTLIYSKNVADASAFSYSKDVHAGIYAIFSHNVTSGKTETLVNSAPGGASRPELSRDGKTLAFVRRVRDKEALVVKDLETGTIHNVWHGLTYDLSTVSAPMGTYPSFAFTPSDDAVIIWAAGQIWHVPLKTNERGEKTASSSHAPSPIAFTAHIEKRLAETRSNGPAVAQELKEVSSAETERVYAFKELRANEDGSAVVFQAAGVSYVQPVGKAAAQKVPVLQSGAAYYSPTFVRGAPDLVLHARWSDTNFTSFELANLTSQTAQEITGLPLGRYYSPILCACSGDHRTLAFVKTGGDLLTGDIVATANPGLYIGEITFQPTSAHITIQNVHFVPSEIDVDDLLKMHFVETNKKLLVQQSSRSFIVDFGAAPTAEGEYPHKEIATGETSVELAVSSPTSEYVAFVDFLNVYVAPGGNVLPGEAVWSRPGNATKGLARVSLDGGHDITWSQDGKTLLWFLGPYLHSLEVSKLSKCSSAIQDDALNFGISCTRYLLAFQEVVVKHPTSLHLLKQDASKHVGSGYANADADADVLVIKNATILTMETGQLHGDLITDGVLVTRGGVIESIGNLRDGSLNVPVGASVIDAHGGLIVPGFIDVHAHWGGFETLYPAASWELETFLAYGVTTLHNPSADNVNTFAERSRVESGQIIGPRIFQTGQIIYGAGAPGYHHDVVDMDEARSALIRIKAEGGPASFSYKNYNLPSRASRQRLLLAARNLSMLCVPEGGMNYDWDLTYIVDGMTTVEHALPVPVLYDDILTLYALSGTGSTPTHLVNYGGAWGEQLVWAHDPASDSKLRRFTRHDILEVISESTARPANSWAYLNTSASVAKMVDMGLRTHIGAHGEPPLGVNYHAEIFFAQQGGLSNYEVLKAATSNAAITLGLQPIIGSLSPGKFADFLVYPPGVDLVHGDLTRSKEIRYVVKGGRVWDAESMTEVWPVKGRKQDRPPINAE